tara:strand:- start:60 stop:923 length:864 start_codon:yes stop_codon:yes gene_type:complete
MADENTGPSPLGSWGTQALGRDEFFSERGKHYRGSPLGMGAVVPKNVGPMITRRPSPIGGMSRPDPLARMQQQGKTLSELEKTAKAKASEPGGRTARQWGEDASLAADLTMGVTLARTKEERDAAINRAAMVGSMKALQHGVEAAVDFFDEDTAKEAVSAAATDETTKIIKNAGGMSKDASLISDATGVAEGAMSAIGLASDVAQGDVASMVEKGAAATGASAGATAGTAVLPGIGTAVGAWLGDKAGKATGTKLAEVAKLRKKRMRSGGGALTDPSKLGGIGDYLA